MRNLRRSLLIVALVATTLLTIVLALLNRTVSRRVTETGQSDERILPQGFLEGKGKTLDTSTFTKQGYAIPLEQDTIKSAYSSRAQLRGVVTSISATMLELVINDETKTIHLPGAVYLYCAPKYFTGLNGAQVPSTQVRLDFSRGQNAGTLLSSDALSRKFRKGDDMTVLVNVGEGETMTAYLVAGYGCSET